MLKTSTSLDSNASHTWKKRMRINRKLLALKFLLFIKSTGGSILFPFYTIHCLSLGLTLTENGIIFALIPVFGCFGNPLAGFLADKFGDYKKVVVSFIMLCVLCNALLGFAVPIYSKKTLTTTNQVDYDSFVFQCQENSHIRLDIATFNELARNSTGCVLELRENKNFSSQLCAESCRDVKISTLCDDLETSLNQCNLTSFRNLPKATVKNSSFWTVEDFHVTVLKKDEFESLNKTTPSCRSTSSSSCLLDCEMNEMDIFLQCKEEQIIGNRMTTFLTYTLYRVVGNMAGSSGLMLVTAAAVQMVRQQNGDYGFHQSFSLLGGFISPPLGGYLVGLASAKNNKQDFSPIFIVFCVMFSFSALLICFMDFKVKPPGKQIWSNVWRLLHNPKIASYVFIMFLIGCFYGILENYLFWFMQNFLDSPKWLLGMTSTVSALSALPVVFASTWIIKLCGHTKIFMLSLILYGVRFIGYSFVYDPYLILPIEVLEAFTFSLTWVVATVYNSKVAPAYVATLQGLVSALHYSVGRGAGSLVAGTLFDYYPPRLVYQMVSAAATGCGVIYALLYWVWLRKVADPKNSLGVAVSEAVLAENVRRQSMIGEYYNAAPLSAEVIPAKTDEEDANGTENNRLIKI